MVKYFKWSKGDLALLFKNWNDASDFDVPTVYKNNNITPSTICTKQMIVILKNAYTLAVYILYHIVLIINNILFYFYI